MQHLIEKRNDLADRMNTLAAIKNRSTAQTKELDAVCAQFDDLTAEIDLAQSIGARNARLARSPRRPDPLASASLTEFVRNVALNPDAVKAATATTYAGEGAAADGGVLAPAEYSRVLEVLLKGPDSLLGLCDGITSLTNSIVLPVDEDAPWSVAGIAAADVAEGAAYGESKPVFKSVQVSLVKTGVLVPVSEELLTDAVNIGGYVAQKSADKLQWKLNAKAFTAFMASGAKIVQPKGSLGVGAAPDIDAVLGMFANIPVALLDSAVWLANPRLQTTMMKYVIGQHPVFVSGGSLANAPHDMLLGKRVIWSELCSAIGTEGDLVLVAPKGFYAVTKGAPRASVSAHLFFDADQIAYKTSARTAVKSKFSAPITRPDSTAVGNVVTLATR